MKSFSFSEIYSRKFIAQLTDNFMWLQYDSDYFAGGNSSCADLACELYVGTAGP